MEQEQHRGFKASWFFKWFINNKVVAALAIVLLLLLNILLLNKVGFIFKPVGEFITVISLPVILAAVFYYLLNPIVDFLEKKRVPRVVTIIVLFLIIAALIAWGLIVAIPNIISGVDNFASSVPHYVNTAQKEINALAKNPHFEQFRPQVDQFAKSIGNQLIDWSKAFSVNAVTTLSHLISKNNKYLNFINCIPICSFLLIERWSKIKWICHSFIAK